MLFFLQTDCFHWKKASNWLFWWKNKILNISEELEVYIQHFKKSTKKMATPVRYGYSDFGQNWKVPKNSFSFLQTVCFHERTTFCMFQKNWKGIFNISKNQPKKWPRRLGPDTVILVKIEKSAKYAVFLQTECFPERTKFSMFQKNSKGIFNIWKINQKNGLAGEFRIQRFWSKLKGPQKLIFFP